MTQSTTGTGGTATASRLLLVILCGVQFVDAVDIATMGPAVPKIQVDLGMSAAALQWVVSAYVLGYGGFLLLGGRLADIFNRKRLLIGAMLIFVVASLVGGVALSGNVLIGARLAKGIAAAFTAPAALAILLHSYQDEQERHRALGVYLAIAAIGFTLGLILGGIMADITWRLTMFFPAALGIILLVSSAVVVPRTDGSAAGERPRIDVLGAVVVTGGLLLLVYAFSNAGANGWSNVQTPTALVAAIVLLLVFLIIERTVSSPLVPLHIFRRPGLSQANVVVFLLEGGYVGWSFVMTLYLQNELHWSPLEVGIAFAPGGVITALTAQRWAGQVARIGAWPLAAGGLLLQGSGFLWSALMFGHVNGWVLAIVAISLMGTGFAAAYPAANITAVGGARPEEQGLASGLFIASFQIGGGVVLGVAASVLTANASLGIGAYRAAMLIVVGAAALALLIALAGLARRRPAAVRESAEAT
jgi:MFS family permease